MNGNQGDWLDNRKKMIKALFEQTNQVLAFNMAGGIKPIPHDTLIAYADAQEIFEYCKTFTSRAPSSGMSRARNTSMPSSS